jgi:lauroyl/myristoyl acyltransferase
MVETDNSGVKKLLKALKNNYGIGILPDHSQKINQGVMAVF